MIDLLEPKIVNISPVFKTVSPVTNPMTFLVLVPLEDIGLLISRITVIKETEYFCVNVKLFTDFPLKEYGEKTSAIEYLLSTLK